MSDQEQEKQNNPKICLPCNKILSRLKCCGGTICSKCLINNLINETEYTHRGWFEESLCNSFNKYLKCPYCNLDIDTTDLYTVLPCQVCDIISDTVYLCKTCKNLYLCEKCWYIIHNPKTSISNHEKTIQLDKDHLENRSETIEIFWNLFEYVCDSKDFKRDILNYENLIDNPCFEQIKDIKDLFQKIKQFICEQEMMIFEQIDKQNEIKIEKINKAIVYNEKRLETQMILMLTGKNIECDMDVPDDYYNSECYKYNINTPMMPSSCLFGYNYGENRPNIITIQEKFSTNKYNEYGAEWRGIPKLCKIKLYSEKAIAILDSIDYKSEHEGTVNIILVGGGGSGNYANGGGSGEIKVIACKLEKDKIYKIVVGKSDQVTSFNEEYYANPGRSPTNSEEGGSGTCGGGVSSCKNDDMSTSGGSLHKNINIGYDGVSNLNRKGGSGIGIVTDTKHTFDTLRELYNFLSPGSPGCSRKPIKSLVNGYPGGGGGGGLNIKGVKPISDAYLNTGFGAGGSSYFDGENFINTPGNEGIIIICGMHRIIKF